jgi:hypothetical protein
MSRKKKHIEMYKEVIRGLAEQVGLIVSFSEEEKSDDRAREHRFKAPPPLRGDIVLREHSGGFNMWVDGAGLDNYSEYNRYYFTCVEKFEDFILFCERIRIQWRIAEGD